jgi:integrase
LLPVVAAATLHNLAASYCPFFHDRHGRPWKDAQAFRRAFNKLRARLVLKYGSFATRYYVGLVDGDPLAVPTAELTMRTMRHTCVTLNFDAGVPPNLIGGITGHSPDEINDILAHYRARTADQAAAALELRMAHEAKREVEA